MADKDPIPPVKPVDPPKVSEFSFAGWHGGPFAVYGPVGERQPSITIGGRMITPTAWNDHSIKGEVPDDLRGDVDVTFNGVTIKGKV